jgi:predicted nuclease with RNAse H fold
MKTLGVDLASADTTTAACLVDWNGCSPLIEGVYERNVSDEMIVELARGADVTGVDAPFGWPRPFADAITSYAAGHPWPRERPVGLWLRLTDMRTQAVSGGRPPLSVSSDRIARPAERAARLLTLLGEEERAARRDGSDDVIEVYPAGALRCWGIDASGYKHPTASSIRDRIVTEISDGLALTMSGPQRQVLAATDHALDALVAALVARAFSLRRVVGPTNDERSIALVEGWIYLPSGPLAELRVSA